MSSTVRIGYVSSIDYSTGMLRITYPDKDDATTAEFPSYCFGGEYLMPKVQDQVLVLHLSNDTSSGIVMGKYWNEENLPPVTGEAAYYKQLPGEAYEQLTGNAYVLHSDNITFECDAGSITVEELIRMRDRIEDGGET